METQFAQFSGSMNPAPVPSPKPMGMIIKIVIGVVVLALVVTTIPLATRIWDPLWNPFRPNPDKVVRQAIENMTELKSLHLKIDTKVSAFSEEMSGDFSLFLEGSVDRRDESNPQGEANFNIELISSGDSGFSPGNIAIKGQTKLSGQEGYLYLEDLRIGFLAIFLGGMDLDVLTDRWIKFESEEDPAEVQEEAKEVIEGHNIFYVKKQLKNEKIDGEKVYHYIVAIDKEEFKELTKEQNGDVEDVEEFFTEAGEITFDIWIGIKDKLVYKVEYIDEIKIDSAGLDIDLTIEISEFNESVVVEVPEEFITMEEIMFEIMLSSMIFEDLDFELAE